MQANSEASIGPLVGLREAARVLTEAGHPISHSTLSRQVGKLIPNRGTPAKPLVNVDEVIQARRDNVDPRLQRQKQPQLLPAPNTEAAAQPASAQQDAPASVNSHRADLERAKAKLAEIDLEERRGNLVDRRDVADAIETAAHVLRDQLIACADVLAPDLAGMTDSAAIRVKIEEAHRKALAELVKTFKRISAAAADDGADAA